jgi:hypothetical protein
MGGDSVCAPPCHLDGKVVGLLPNWRPSAVHILRAVGALLQERYRLESLVMEQPVRELPLRSGKLLDTMKDQLDALAHRLMRSFQRPAIEARARRGVATSHPLSRNAASPR